MKERLLVAGCAGFVAALVGLALVAMARDNPPAPAHAFTGLIRAKLVWPVVDAAHHRVFGVVGRDVVVLDEMTGRISPLVRFPAHHTIMSSTLDSASGRLLVEDVVLQGSLPDGRSKQVVSTAHLVDAATGRVAGSTLIKRYHGVQLPGTYGGGTAVDTTLHRGFVIDPYGFGVMLDTVTGAVVARFRVNEPASVNIESNLAVVDDLTHRLFFGVLPHSTARWEELLEMLDTRTGKTLGYARDSWGLLIVAVALDRLSDRVFAAHLQHNLVVVDGRSGRVVARPRVGEQSGSLAVDDQTGHVFVLSGITRAGGEQDTAVWLLDASGHVLRGPMLGKLAGAVQLLVDGPAHRLVMFDSSSKVKLFDTRTLKLRHTYALQNDTVYGMAVDEQTHRVIIGGHDGTTMLNSGG